MAFQLTGAERGAFLLEAAIAVTIAAIVITGLAVSLTRCIEAATSMDRDAKLRIALENRIAQVRQERLVNGNALFASSDDKVLIEQTISDSPIVNARADRLAGIREVHLRAFFPESDWPPLTTKIILYRP